MLKKNTNIRKLQYVFFEITTKQRKASKSERKRMKSLTVYFHPVVFIYPPDSWDNVVDVKYMAIVTKTYFWRYRQ